MRRAAFALILVALPALAADLSGPARVVDGDTLHIGETKIRLHGIDAPESRQECRRDGATWPCGTEATAALRAMTEGRTVDCEDLGRDRYGRTIARCRAGGIDVAGALVAQGLALAYRRFSEDYVPAEDEARTARRGMWAGTFDRPEDWRKKK